MNKTSNAIDTINVCIVGLGLIGGSLGLGLKAKFGANIHVYGVDKDPAAVAGALARRAVDAAGEELAEGCRTADVVFLCAPVLQIEALAAEATLHLKPGAVLTDVGSTKRRLSERLTAVLPPGITYIGGHPITGKEKSGIMAAEEGLFRDKWYIIVRGTSVQPKALALLVKLVEGLGAKIAMMDSEDHDRCTAVISHIPHIAAAALVHLLAMEAESDVWLKLTAGGFRDTTRIASSDPDMWADICITNQEAIAGGLRRLQAILSTVLNAVEQGDREALRNYFLSAKRRRDDLLAQENGESSGLK